MVPTAQHSNTSSRRRNIQYMHAWLWIPPQRYTTSLQSLFNGVIWHAWPHETRLLSSATEMLIMTPKRHEERHASRAAAAEEPGPTTLQYDCVTSCACMCVHVCVCWDSAAVYSRPGLGEAHGQQHVQSGPMFHGARPALPLPPRRHFGVQFLFSCHNSQLHRSGGSQTLRVCFHLFKNKK